MWKYSQSTGQLTSPDSDTPIATGYAGNGKGLNNPAMQHVRNVGPLPAGDWTIGPMFKHLAKGPVCMRLAPTGHDALGRSGFMIHGDNSMMNKTASEGCLILPRNIRERIARSTDKLLRVTS